MDEGKQGKQGKQEKIDQLTNRLVEVVAGEDIRDTLTAMGKALAIAALNRGYGSNQEYLVTHGSRSGPRMGLAYICGNDGETKEHLRQQLASMLLEDQSNYELIH